MNNQDWADKAVEVLAERIHERRRQLNVSLRRWDQLSEPERQIKRTDAADHLKSLQPFLPQGLSEEERPWEALRLIAEAAAGDDALPCLEAAKSIAQKALNERHSHVQPADLSGSTRERADDHSRGRRGADQASAGGEGDPGDGDPARRKESQSFIGDGERDRLRRLAHTIGQESGTVGDWWDCVAKELRALADRPQGGEGAWLCACCGEKLGEIEGGKEVAPDDPQAPSFDPTDQAGGSR